MKKIMIITTAILLSAGISAFAGNKKEKSIEKNFYQLSFDRIVVEDEIDLRLSENTEKEIEISGDNKYTQQVEWKIKDGVLYIRSKGASLRHKAQVSLSVSQLKDITVKGESEVRSEGALNSDDLKVHVDGEGHIAIRNTGNITVEKADHIDLNIHRLRGNVNIN